MARDPPEKPGLHNTPSETSGQAHPSAMCRSRARTGLAITAWRRLTVRFHSRISRIKAASLDSGPARSETTPPPTHSGKSGQAHTWRVFPELTRNNLQSDKPNAECRQPPHRDLPAPHAAGNISTATTSAGTKRPVSLGAPLDRDGGGVSIGTRSLDCTQRSTPLTSRAAQTWGPTGLSASTARECLSGGLSLHPLGLVHTARDLCLDTFPRI